MIPSGDCEMLYVIMTFKTLLRTAALVLLIACFAPRATGEVRLPGMLGSHMVLQRSQPIHIWGWAVPGEKVAVAMHGASRSTAADELGKWSVYLPPEPAGGPYQLTITATNTIVLDDVLIGDVWFASGQSNMEMPLKGWPGAPVQNSAEEIAHAAQPGIRLLVIHQKTSEFPLRDIEGRWTTCTPETAADFSALAYLFGRELAAKENVPIGLIDSTWGGTVVEAWMSLNALSADASLMPAFATRAQMMDSQADVPAVIAKEHREDEAAAKAGLPKPNHVWNPNPASWGPAALFNGMVAPATPFGIKGVIWYQGESNSRQGFAPMYARLFPALIADWRAQWHQGDFPFLFVQISSFTSNATESWPTIREAQRRTLSLTNTAMAVTIDIGDPDNVHPANKQTVGARLALAARALAYAEPLEYSGPLFRQAAPDEQGMRIWFDHAADGLLARDGALQGFEIAGVDHRFVKAAARIDGNTVVVTSPQVAAPAYVRYGWENAPVVNLYNSTGLPASPFTSE
jgi:sialate O-acetylesterase